MAPSATSPEPARDPAPPPPGAQAEFFPGSDAGALPPETVPRASEREREFFLRLGRLGLEVARAALGPGLLLLLVFAADRLYDLPKALATTARLVVAIPLLWRLSGALLRGIFRPDSERFRIAACGTRTARHLYRWLLVVGRLAAVLDPLGRILVANDMPRGVIEALSLAHEVLTFIALVMLFSRRGIARDMIPEARTRIGAGARRLSLAAYPFFALYVVGLIGLHAVGYLNLARYLGRSTAYTAGVFALAGVLWKLSALLLDLWLESRARAAAAALAAAGASEAEAGDHDLADARSIFHAGRALTRAAIVLATGAGILLAWGQVPAEVARLFTARSLLSWAEGDHGERIVAITMSDVVSSFVTFVVALLAGRLLRGLTMRRLGRAGGLDRGMRHAISNLVFAVVVSIGAYVALGSLHVNADAVKWLAGSLGIGVGFGLQNIVNNYVSGVILLIEKPIRTDDIVEVGGVVGRVDQIGTRSTVVIDEDNIARIIPNSEFVSAQVTNHSYGDPRTRIRCAVGVAYGSDPQVVKRVMMAAAELNKLVLKQPVPDVMFKEFGDSTLIFELACYILEPQHAKKIESDLHYALEVGFRAADVKVAAANTDMGIVFRNAMRVLREEPAAPPSK